jgi:CheY-like chemotaxis protein
VTYTLLLADDSVTIQRVIELTFAEEDVQVVAVSDGDQAIQRLESAPPDIVLADIGMPGRNGYEVARYVRQTPKLAHIPVVLLTGAFEPVDHAKATEVGCDGVLAKPFEPQLVIGRVKELLASPVRRAAAMDAPTASSVTAAPAASYASEAITDESPAASATNLDDYFDQLDTAFANIGAPTAPATQSAATSPTVATFATFTPGAAAPLDDAVAIEESPAPDLPLSYASLAPSEPVAAASVEVSPPPPAAPPVARELPSVAEAFAAILAAEQHEESVARPVWPSSPPAAPGPSAEIGEAVVDQIVERVLSRLAVGDRVSEVAERLVREEIERIKASIG